VVRVAAAVVIKMLLQSAEHILDLIKPLLQLGTSLVRGCRRATLLEVRISIGLQGIQVIIIFAKL
jgi:hypothetical protein